MGVDELGRARGDHHHARHGREDREAGVERRVVEHVLQELLPDEHRAHQGPEHDHPCARRHPEDAAPCHAQVVQREPGPALANHEGDPCRKGDDPQPGGDGSFARHRGEVDRQHERRHQQDRDDAAEVVDRVRRLVDVCGHVAVGHVQGNHGERQRHQEHGSPFEPREQCAREHRSERRDRTAQGRPQRNRLRPLRSRPERGDQRERRGKRHARCEAAGQARGKQHLDGRREGGKHGRGDRQGGAQDQHPLAPVAVTDGAQIEDRGGEPERVPNGNEIELGLPGIERLADIRQRDVRDRQIQVRDGRDENERDEHDAGVRRRGAVFGRRGWDRI